MIDPNSIIVYNNNKSNEIKVINLNDFDSEIPVYNLDDDKDFKKYINDIEKMVRTSFEYKILCRYLRENFGMDRCAFLANVSNEDNNYNVKIELHHYPFSLFDIVNIVYRKRTYNHESLSVAMVAEEVLQLHYQLLIGLIPLSETVHQLVHSGRLFIPVNKVLGRYKIFVDIYHPYIDPEQLDTLRMIERATDENSEVGDTTILNTNNVRYNITDKRYQLPQIGTISESMFNRLEAIKQNNYILPTVNEAKQIEERKLYCPIHIKSVG